MTDEKREYFYVAYDLLIRSEIELPELVERPAEIVAESDVTVQVHIRSTLQDSVSDADQTTLQVTSDELRLDVSDVALFVVRGGREIFVHPHAGAEEDVIRLFLLGSAFGAIFLQRGLVVLHGNAIRIGDSCLVCVGPSGIGKSTLAAAFMQAGYEVLSDDVVPVDASCRTVRGFPRLKLWEDAAEKLRIATSGLPRIGFNLNKFNVAVSQPDEPARQFPIRWVFVLDASPNLDHVDVRRVRGMDCIVALMANIYRPSFVERMSLQTSHLQRCAELANRAYLATVKRPTKSFMVDELVNQLVHQTTDNP